MGDGDNAADAAADARRRSAIKDKHGVHDAETTRSAEASAPPAATSICANRRMERSVATSLEAAAAAADDDDDGDNGDDDEEVCGRH